MLRAPWQLALIPTDFARGDRLPSMQSAAALTCAMLQLGRPWAPSELVRCTGHTAAELHAAGLLEGLTQLAAQRVHNELIAWVTSASSGAADEYAVREWQRRHCSAADPVTHRLPHKRRQAAAADLPYDDGTVMVCPQPCDAVADGPQHWSV